MSDTEPSWAPLDPGRDPERWEAMVRSIVARAEPVLARYREPRPIDRLAHWLRPTLAAAAVVALVAGGTLWRAGGGPSATGASAEPIGPADALGYPSSVTAWIEAGRVPSAEELVVAMEERDR